MRTLQVFACSYGKNGASTPNIEFSDDGCWGQRLADRSDRKLINHSRPGACNYDIFHSILAALPTITEDDLVIIHWTHMNRVYSHKGTVFLGRNRGLDISQRAIDEYYRYCYDDAQALAHIVAFQGLITSKLPCPVLYSTADSLRIIEKIPSPLVKDLTEDPLFVNDGDTPLGRVWSEPTWKTMYDCLHPKPLGHEIMADLFYSALCSRGL